MSRLNTKQRRARFRNSETGKKLLDLRRRFYGYDGLVKVISNGYPLFRGGKAL